MLQVNTIDENDLNEAKEMLETNVLGVLAFCRAFIPVMKAQGRGHVVNISSIAGHGLSMRRSLFGRACVGT